LVYYKRVLINLFARIQVLRSDPLNGLDECLGIQEILIQRIIYIEKRIRFLRRRIKSSKKILGTKGVAPAKGEQASEIKDSVANYEYQIEEYKKLLHIFRNIGDALAYIYIPQSDIRPLGLKESSGFISGKKGLKVERTILQFLFQKGIPAILNDLTNCLRYGDITAITENGCRIIEAKTSDHKNERNIRQLANLEKIKDYLNTGQATELHATGFTSLRVHAHSEERHHRDQLNEMIGEAYRIGSYSCEIEKGLYYYIATKFQTEEVKIIFDSAKSNKFSFYLNKFKYVNAGYYPFTLTIVEPEVLYAFYSGQFVFLVIIDREIIARSLASRGLTVTFHENGPFAFSASYTDSSEIAGPMEISRYGLSRVACEFLSLDWFMEEIIYEMQHHEDIKNISAVARLQSESKQIVQKP
jgi:Holliday junction resolvase